MHIISKTDSQHEIDMTNENQYILSVKIDENIQPVVVNVDRSFDKVKEYLLTTYDTYKTIEGESEFDKRIQQMFLYGLMIGIVKCVARAGDEHIIEQLKVDEDTKHLFFTDKNDELFKRPNMISERSDAEIDLEAIFGKNRKKGSKSKSANKGTKKGTRKSKGKTK